MIYFTPTSLSHMLCCSAGLVWPLFGIAGTIWSASSTCKPQLFFAKYNPRYQLSQASTFTENWHTGSLTVSKATHEAPGPVVTPFEDYIRSREDTKNTMKLNMPRRHPIKSTRCSLYETKIGQHTDELIHYMPGEYRALRLHRLATAAMRRDAMTRQPYHVPVFQTPNGP